MLAITVSILQHWCTTAVAIFSFSWKMHMIYWFTNRARVHPHSRLRWLQVGDNPPTRRPVEHQGAIVDQHSLMLSLH
ncbi:hypothetical protein D7Y32_08305 [Stenotrophomonas maltophilia]|nr:hypothetical protein [Stenotrophomonas maltophilia]